MKAIPHPLRMIRVQFKIDNEKKHRDFFARQVHIRFIKKRLLILRLRNSMRTLLWDLYA